MVLNELDLRLSSVLQKAKVHYNLSPARLVEAAIRRGEGYLAANGAFCTTTGKYTGRSPKDKFIVDEPSVRNKIAWGPVNQPISAEKFVGLYRRVMEYLENKELFVFDGFAGADPLYRLPIRIVNEFAWQNLFARQLFIRPAGGELERHQPQFTVVCVPHFQAIPERDGTNSEAFIVISFEKRLVLIGGTEYAGEIKKSVFTVMNYLLPEQNVLSMHCSANVGKKGDVALFFGLSGTGKTTLSADPDRRLIGDDEHGWSDQGVFNLEGGCYAKCINLSREKEPQIWNAIQFGAVLENVVVDEATRIPDYSRNDLTENTRAAYPVDYIPGALIPGIGGHPEVIIFLTADAFGVLPPVARLSEEQAMFHFLSGYTSKLAGTERGVTAPEATFSTCFGAPFLPLKPYVYAEMLGEKIRKHKARVYLVNTGWTGGPYGVGRRINLAHTRAIVTAVLNKKIEEAEFVPDPVFGLHIPSSCPGVPDEILNPRNTWADPGAYDRAAKELANRFLHNFQKFAGIAESVKLAGPKAD